MNKLVIPGILAATVLVAGMFAFMPVEKASTVHTTILAQATRATTMLTFDPTTVIPNNSYIMLYDGAGTGSTSSLEVNFNAATLPAGLTLEQIAPGAASWTVVATAPFPITAGSTAAAEAHADTVATALRLANTSGAAVTPGANSVLTVTIVGS